MNGMVKKSEYKICHHRQWGRKKHTNYIKLGSNLEGKCNEAVVHSVQIMAMIAVISNTIKVPTDIP